MKNLTATEIDKRTKELIMKDPIMEYLIDRTLEILEEIKNQESKK